jgi:hypothetical protein
MSFARRHVAAAAYAGHLNPFESVLLSVLIGVARRVKSLEGRAEEKKLETRR